MRTWPLADVLTKLADAAEHLLGAHGCDAHGYEEVEHAVKAARHHSAALASRVPPSGEPQYATLAELYNTVANELDETRTLDTKRRLTAAMEALDTRIPLPPRAGATGEAVAMNAAQTALARMLREWDWVSTDEEDALIVDTVIAAYRNAAPPAPAPAGVTEAMVEACIQYELSTYSRPTFAPIVLEQAREFYRGVLAAALTSPEATDGK